MIYRILADENIPGPAINRLRELGYDVVWIREVAPGSADRDVLLLSKGDRRLLVTFDKDFGELCFRHGYSAVEGIILFRPRKAPPALYINWITTIIGSREDWRGHFSVVELDRVRMVEMPGVVRES